MAFFNWLSGDSSRRASGKSAGNPAAPMDRKQAKAERSKPADAAPEHAAPGAEARGESGKVKRHARRDQLYVAIREAMTHAGVLSSGYKFKVLSLDPRGSPKNSGKLRNRSSSTPRRGSRSRCPPSIGAWTTSRP